MKYKVFLIALIGAFSFCAANHVEKIIRPKGSGQEIEKVGKPEPLDMRLIFSGDHDVDGPSPAGRHLKFPGSVDPPTPASDSEDTFLEGEL